MREMEMGRQRLFARKRLIGNSIAFVRSFRAPEGLVPRRFELSSFANACVTAVVLAK
jgi:hypothetical protein